MTIDEPKLTEPVLQPPVEAGGAPPSDDPFAADLRGFGPLGILAMLVIIAGQILAPLNALLVLVWARRSHTPWHEIGYGRPQSWLAGMWEPGLGSWPTVLVCMGLGLSAVSIAAIRFVRRDL